LTHSCRWSTTSSASWPRSAFLPNGATTPWRQPHWFMKPYLRLVGTDIDWQNRAHFYAIAARVMRRILVDHARTKKRDKRVGGSAHLFKKLMRHSCNTSVAHRAALRQRTRHLGLCWLTRDAGTARGCLFLGGFSHHENGRYTRLARGARRLRRIRLALISILPLPSEPTFRRKRSGWDCAPEVESVLCHQLLASPGTAPISWETSGNTLRSSSRPTSRAA
jgi:hypothetical protein